MVDLELKIEFVANFVNVADGAGLGNELGRGALHVKCVGAIRRTEQGLANEKDMEDVNGPDESLLTLKQ